MGKKDKGKKPERTPQENEQIQAILADYNQLAKHLAKSRNEEQVENVLSPIFDMSEAAQVGLLKALAKEETTPAADIVLAVNTYAPIKEVRKEARRSLIQLEGSDTYPEWTIPSIMSLSDIVGLDAFNDFEGDDEEDEDFEDGENIIERFLRYWGEGDFELSYDLLTTNSPLKEGLTREEWTARRQVWAEEAGLNAESIKVDVGYTLAIDEEDLPDDLLENGVEELDAFWSIEMKDVLSNSVPELPTATITLPATGRHWFWASYTFLTEEDELRLHSMRDRGAEALQLSADEIEERLKEITGELQAMAEALTEDEVDNEDEEDEDEVDNDEIEDEELEVDIDEVRWFTKQSLHYSDALIAHPPIDDNIYAEAASQASTIDDLERAAAYYTIAVERLPKARGNMLRSLGSTYSELVTQDNEEHDIEEGMEEDEENTVSEAFTSRYVQLAEKAFRDAIAIDNDFANYILLINLLFQQRSRFAEISPLFEQAQAVAKTPRDRATIEFGVARLALLENKSEEALAHLENVANLAPDMHSIWYNIGEVQLALEQRDAAEESFLKSIEFDPATSEAYGSLATLYAEDGKEDAAIRVLEEGLEANPDAIDLMVAQATLYLTKGDLSSAEKLVSKAEEIGPDLGMASLVHQVIDLQKLQTQQQQLPSSSKPNKSKKRQ